MREGAQNVIETFGDVLGQKSQDRIAIFLKQRVFSPVAPVGLSVG